MSPRVLSAAEPPLAQSTVSQHLEVLREAGLIHGEVDGPRIRHCADRLFPVPEPKPCVTP